MYWSKISTPKKTKKEEVPIIGNDSNMKISVRLIALLLVCMMLSVALVACTTVDEVVKGVTVEGCKYPLKNATLRRRNQFAVSNEITGNVAFISVKKGVVYIIESRDL